MGLVDKFSNKNKYVLRFCKRLGAVLGIDDAKRNKIAFLKKQEQGKSSLTIEEYNSIGLCI